MTIREEGNTGRFAEMLKPEGNTNLTTNDDLFTADVYVLYRSQYPDKATVEDVQKKLKQNKIDFSQMKEYGTDHCQ
jgi:hypothetical protein